MSPVFHRESSYTFKIFSNEELRMRIHVFRDNLEAKFWLEPEVELAENYGFKAHELRRIQTYSRKSCNKSQRTILPAHRQAY